MHNAMIVATRACAAGVSRFTFRPNALTAALAAAAVLFAGQSGLASVAFTGLGTLGGSQSFAYALSADGQVVGGVADVAGDTEGRAFRWTSAGGMQNLGSLGGPESITYGLNSNGSVATGIGHIAAGQIHAFRWASGSGIQDIGTVGGRPSSQGFALSADGSVAVGGVSRAFRWTSAGGMQDLGTFGGTASSANAVSADGSVVAGSANTAAGVPHAFRWTNAGGLQDMGTLGTTSIAKALSADGSVGAGYSQVLPALGQSTSGYHAFRWTDAGGMQDLGTLGGATAYGFAISSDGSTIVGASDIPADGIQRAFLWTQSLGMVDLNTYLPALGVNLTGWLLVSAQSISADGTAIAGYGIHNGQNQAFLISGIPAPGAAGLLVLAGLGAARRRRRY